MENKHQMITVCEYLKMLDMKYINNDEQELKSNAEKYLLSVKRANTNARILEELLT